MDVHLPDQEPAVAFVVQNNRALRRVLVHFPDEGPGLGVHGHLQEVASRVFADGAEEVGRLLQLSESFADVPRHSSGAFGELAVVQPPIQL